MSLYLTDDESSITVTYGGAFADVERAGVFLFNKHVEVTVEKQCEIARFIGANDSFDIDNVD
ncbi:11629_t:CDS:2, partial [Racocetra fulgida]